MIQREWHILRTHSRSNMPALWISAHPAKRREASRSCEIPSDCEGEDTSCGGVARGFARSEPILGLHTDTGAMWRLLLLISTDFCCSVCCWVGQVTVAVKNVAA